MIVSKTEAIFQICTKPLTFVALHIQQTVSRVFKERQISQTLREKSGIVNTNNFANEKGAR